MVYLIIGLAVLFILVPILAVLPSPRQREQMAMRNAARAAGVLVELTSIDDPNPKQDKYISPTGRPLPPKLQLAAYRKQRKRQSDWRQLPRVDWCLQRKLEAGWVWQGEVSDDLSSDFKAWLESLVETLPVDVHQVEEVGYMVSVYWHEKAKETVDDVLDFLNQCVEKELYAASVLNDEDAGT